MKERTYRYFTGKALYPFGFGLSYTTFEVKDCAVDAENGWVTATVANKQITALEIKPEAVDPEDAIRLPLLLAAIPEDY